MTAECMGNFVLETFLPYSSIMDRGSIGTGNGGTTIKVRTSVVLIHAAATYSNTSGVASN